MNLPASNPDTNPSKQAALSVRQLTLSIDDSRRRRTLVKDVDLELVAGEILGLVGESGSGKSLTAYALLGLLPDRTAKLECSQFLLNGQRQLATLTEKQWRPLRGRHIALISQEPQSSLDPVLAVGRQLLRIIQRHLLLDSTSASQLLQQALKDCGLTDPERIMGSFPHQLSGGMRQRVMIALALACRAEVLIADEPTSALDIASRDQVLALLRRAASRRNTAVMLISHDLAAVSRICDQTHVMYAGQIVESGRTRQVLDHPRHPYTAALLRATPRLASNDPEPVEPIPGTVQGLPTEGSACSFASRCTQASAQCSRSAPSLADLAGSGQAVACHHPLRGKHS